MELLLVRHGESTANVARERAELSGAEQIAVEARDADVGLSELGQRQSEALGLWLATQADCRVDAVWSSPYRRARDTATNALTAAGLDLDIRIDERLRDKELGILDTFTSTGIRNRFPEEAERRRWLGKFYYRAPGGESWADVALRVRSVLADIVGSGRHHPMIVCHDAVIMLFRYVCEGLDETTVVDIARADPVGNTAVSRLAAAADAPGWALVEYNSQAHLLRDGADLRTTHPASEPRPDEAT